MNSFVKHLGEQDAFAGIMHGGLKPSLLPAFVRVLLTTDGTVTNSLEAYFWEPVTVETLAQRDFVLPFDAPIIDRGRGDTVVSRQVQLRGRRSNTVYVRAESLIRSDLLSAEFQRDLQAQKLGIGELLRDCGLETYREILQLGRQEQPREVWRTYRIVMDHRPFIQITEHFPLAVYQ